MQEVAGHTSLASPNIEQAYFDARTFGWLRRPIIELVIPSTLDGTLTPRGQHVASLFCQHVVIFPRFSGHLA
jgi:phytoene dehydrogenase-like protein